MSGLYWLKMQPLSILKSRPLIPDTHPLCRSEDAHFCFDAHPLRSICAPEHSGGLVPFPKCSPDSRDRETGLAFLFQEFCIAIKDFGVI